MNIGAIKGKKYIKYVDFSKAVLWKDRQISLSRGAGRAIMKNNVEKIEFIDRKKGEKWSAPVSKVRASATLKQVGQEEQHYIPIEVFKVEKMGKKLPTQKTLI